LAPAAAFAFVSRLPLGLLAGISCALILAASALLLPEMKAGRKARPGSALVEEISE
jgi:hypothetical protein